jgi:hypothetical protein
LCGAMQGVRVSEPEGLEAVSDKPPTAARVTHVVAAALVVVVVPVVLMGVLVGSFAANAMFLGLVYGVVGAKLGGTRRVGREAPRRRSTSRG